jgi:GPH family glycoside/pentoside/hexuronide:cation symporter
LSFRAFFVAGGQVLASAGTAAVIAWGGGGAHGFAVMGGAAAAILFTSFVICFLGTADARRMEATPKSHLPRLEQVRSLLKNGPFVLLMAVKTTQFMAISIISTTKVLFLLNVVQIGYVGLVNLTLVQNVVAALTVPFWTWFARRIGKRDAYLCATALLAALYASWWWTGPGMSMEAVWIRGAINGLAATGTVLMSIAMLPDLMEFDRLRTGQRREGVFSGIYTIVEKIGYAIGPGLIGMLLAMSGYIATTQGRIVQQPPEAIAMLYAGAAWIPALLVVASFVMMMFYRLDEKALKAAREAAAG